MSILNLSMHKNSLLKEIQCYKLFHYRKRKYDKYQYCIVVTTCITIIYSNFARALKFGNAVNSILGLDDRRHTDRKTREYYIYKQS